MALDAYRADMGFFPSTQEGLSVLVRPSNLWWPRKRARWKGPYLSEEDLVDPWGNPLRYAYPRERAEHPAPPDYDVMVDGMVRIKPGVKTAMSPDRKKMAFLPDDMDIWSMGPDQEPYTKDDIGNWDVPNAQLDERE